MENKVDYTVTRQEVETYFTRTFTDREWEALASEIENIFYHYLWADLPMIVADLESIIEEDDNTSF
jgi:hypothetical protein